MDGDGVLRRIDNLAADLISRILDGSDATLALSSAAPLFARATDGAYAGAREFEGSLRVLATVAELLRCGRTATTRELYYLHAAFFTDAKESTAAIARVTAALGVPRTALSLLAATRGWVAGALAYNGRALVAPVPISAEAAAARPDVAPLGARFILVVSRRVRASARAQCPPACHSLPALYRPRPNAARSRRRRFSAGSSRTHSGRRRVRAACS